MRFTPLEIPGACILDIELVEDARGFFARTWCEREMAEQGLVARIAQVSVSFNPRAGTLRGMHYQSAPFEEAKVVRCTRGRIYDVLVDLRPESVAFRRWVAVELDEGERRSLYVPPGVAHGFQTLDAESEVLYQISEFHSPMHARGVRWDDPAFGIDWPLAVTAISERDRSYPDFA